jgi:hypothetical protein
MAAMYFILVKMVVAIDSKVRWRVRWSIERHKRLVDGEGVFVAVDA